MNQTQIEAIRKLREDTGKPKTREGQFLKPFAAKALSDFCEQSAEFAGAVLADGKTLTGCLDSFKVSGQALSDIEAYKLCVQYFMPDAVIEHHMVIATPKKQTSAKVLELKLTDLFGGL